MIKDQHGRIHKYLRISLLDRCNLRCFYCMPEEGIPLLPKSHIMTNEEIVEIARIFTELGVNKIRLTGGEPLIRKGVENILKGLSELDAKLTMTTNAVVLHKHWDHLKNAGINSLNISLDSLQPEKMNRIMRREKFDVIWTNIEEALNRGFHVKINAVAMKGVNDDEITDFIHWTTKKPVHVRFIEFMPFKDNNWDWDVKGISYAEILQTIESHFSQDRVERLTDRPNDTSKNYRIKGAPGTFAVISTVTHPFCDTCDRIRLTADGKIKNCLFSNIETDLLTPYRKGKDIRPIIHKSIWGKHASRAGMEDFEAFANPDLNQENRSMIRIGG